jgi:hypothetical protein
MFSIVQSPKLVNGHHGPYPTAALINRVQISPDFKQDTVSTHHPIRMHGQQIVPKIQIQTPNIVILVLPWKPVRKVII